MKVGNAIREIRKSKQMTQQQLAKICGITQASLSAIENGGRPGEDTLRAIAKALGISVSLLYVMSLDREDVPQEKAVVYDKLFPVIKGLIFDLAQ